MKATDRGLYDYNTTIVKKYGDNNLVKICQMACTRIPGVENGTLEDDSRMYLLPKKSKPTKVYDTKLQNNLSRAKSKIKDYALCNTWDYWCTFTISPQMMDRYDLNGYMKELHNFIHNYNRRTTEEYKVKYLLVPEKHKDGAWHLHGFIKGIKPKDIYTNSHNYLSWKQYEKKFGYISMDPLKDKKRASSYIMKYITKDIARTNSELGAHLYYISQGLELPETIFRGHAQLHCDWDYEHPDGYCKIKTLDTSKIDISEVLEVLP